MSTLFLEKSRNFSIFSLSAVRLARFFRPGGRRTGKTRAVSAGGTAACDGFAAFDGRDPDQKSFTTCNSLQTR